MLHGCGQREQVSTHVLCAGPSSLFLSATANPLAITMAYWLDFICSSLWLSPLPYSAIIFLDTSKNDLPMGGISSKGKRNMIAAGIVVALAILLALANKWNSDRKNGLSSQVVDRVSALVTKAVQFNGQAAQDSNPMFALISQQPISRHKFPQHSLSLLPTILEQLWVSLQLPIFLQLSLLVLQQLLPLL